MKRTIVLLAVLGVALGAATAGAVGIGIEAYAGPSWPVLQDDRTQGSTWGFRLPVAVVPYLTVEPYYASGSYGDKTETTIAGSATRDGGTVTAWGANLLILGGSPEFRFYPFAGLGSTTDARSGAADVTKTGYNFGAGVGFALPMKLGLDVRGELQMIVDGDVSRKFGNLTAGLSYHFLTLP